MSSASAIIGTMERAIRTMQMARASVAGGENALTRAPAQSYSSDESFTDACSHLAESDAVLEDECVFLRTRVCDSAECAV